MECYTGTQYKKFYKAPGHHCFSLMVCDTVGLCSLVLITCLDAVTMDTVTMVVRV